MNKGVLIFAHNNRQVDYARMALVSGKLANKHLGVPVSLVSDESTITWMKESKIYDKAVTLFDKIIITERPPEDQNRVMYDGKEKVVSLFKNSNRSSVWDLTPYDRTLLIDTDYFIFSNMLNDYWDVNSDLLISESYNDILGSERVGYLDKYISDTGIKMLWATTVMFTKNENTKVFFDLVEHIRRNYSRFADIYRFDNRIYRNDISFSIARHILYGFETDNDYSLPPVFSSIDKDILYKIDNDLNLLFLVNTPNRENYYAASVKNRDVHIMNKQSVTRNLDRLLELI